ncbi:heme o synthase [Blochmannia endosymbiont of Camponotus (Colobopsis) obliquus]|uniref:heme o synthase n=1 Tax=Blochmannia endosymbiont of Camponotus (Colobopsis) obliquus TaxID=1505597 RepID=UPI00061A8921|nr:heme o synthase [Blochmannia endosymbiont of Camponotus (Colobopsis) obliquus]AKC60405.1 protoheme IX farnesyltransferase [Blochmannia endosymbiont of Camponotus (Colobopsis) obliquus]
MIKHYLQITKPKIILGNIVSITSGFFLAAQKNINYSLLILLLIAMSAIIASSCILNNIIDRDIDKNMQRTATRVLVTKCITLKRSFIFAIILSTLGFSILITIVNRLTIILAILGFFIYVIIYSMYLKRTSTYSTLIGSISGAIPPVIGYCTVSNHFDLAASILYTIFSVWQIPHFYTIAILYFKEYQNVSIPAFPIKYGIMLTKHHIILHIIIFILSTFLLTLMNFTSYKFLFIVETINSYWLFIALQGYFITKKENIKWAKKMFSLSVFVITSLNIMILIDSIL